MFFKSADPIETQLGARINDGYVEINKIFTQVCGVYLSGVIVVGFIEFLLGRMDLMPILLLFSSVILNIAVSLLSRKIFKQLQLEIIRIYFITGPVTTYFFVLGKGIFLHWWISHLVMVLFSSVALYSLTKNKKLAFWQNGYWIASVCIGNFLLSDPMPWTAVICICGLFLTSGILMIRTMGFLTSSLEKEADLFQRYRIIFDSNPVGISSINSNLEYLSVNRAFQEFIGYSNEELTGKKLTQFIHPDDVASISLSAEELFRSKGNLRRQEHRYIHKSGNVVWGLSSSQTVQDPGFQENFILTVIEDITEIKNREHEVQLNQAKMIASSRMAEIGMMAGGVAHEINNPLAIIQLLSSQLQRGIVQGTCSNEALQTGLGKITHTVERIAKIVRSLRTFSRNSEKDPFEPFSLQQILDDALELCAEKLKTSGVQIRFVGDFNVKPPCRASQIGQVFLNLISNSSDAIQDHSQRWIEVALIEANEKFIISFIDSGSGIPKDVAEKMMLPFFTTKGVGKGTGLGLFISRSIIEDHGGSIYYETRHGHTCFVVELPTNRNARTAAS